MGAVVRGPDRIACPILNQQAKCPGASGHFACLLITRSAVASPPGGGVALHWVGNRMKHQLLIQASPPPAQSDHLAFDPQAALLAWYDANRRDLPWRRNPTPYRVLVSEIMLQQTQVDRVIPYFQRFTERFPALPDLAAAPRAAVIGMWSGLGYNRRAVYLHELARVVMERHGGDLPRDRGALLRLPGIGPYTAGAILSIGFGEEAAAVDTNVQRVLARYAFRGAASTADVARLALHLVPLGRASDWNQALMDLGAMICRARAPRCLICPLRDGCRSAGLRATAPRRPDRSGRSTVPYAGSRRYYRGRLLAAIRSLGSGQQEPIRGVARQLDLQGVAEPKMGWDVIGRSLERDGLAAIRNTPEGLAIGLPD